MSSSTMAQDSHPLFEFRSGDLEPAHRGKRSKRPRPPFSVLSASEGEEEQGFSSSLSDEEVEEEEQQLAAYSLIMLAHAHEIAARTSPPQSHSTVMRSALPCKRKIKRPVEFDEEEEIQKRYKCKTCSKKFVSFQALGGHRASCHKSKSMFMHGGGFDQETVDGVGSCSKDSQNPTVKVHECPICFRVFASGQALGGHKRSHTSISTPSPVRALEQQLDLNMPAPVDVDVESTETGEVHPALPCTAMPPRYEKSEYKFSPYWWMESSGTSTHSLYDDAASKVVDRDLGFNRDLFFVATVN